MTVAQLQELLTTAEFARRMRQSESAIRRKIAEGVIVAYRVGEHGPLRIPVSELERHLRPALKSGRANVAADASDAATARSYVGTGEAA
jgi:excisionase family DNA binding protein